MPNDKDLFDHWLEEAERLRFEGWDFSPIAGRYQDEPLTWSYKELAEQALAKAQVALDMGTGGGEFLSTLEPLSPHLYATESYAPNLEVAKRRLNPLGIDVVYATSDAALPFADETFDLVLNRHEYMVAPEIYRILKPEGWFLTQQVGGQDGRDLNAWLQGDLEHQYYHWSTDLAQHQLQQAGFTIDTVYEQYVLTRFYDIGAVVYYLKAVPWQIPDFSVDRYRDRLYVLHRHIQKTGYLQMQGHRFFIGARKV